MRTLALNPKGVHKGNLALVNARHPIRGGAFPGALTRMDGGIEMDRTAAAVLARLLQDLGCAGQIACVSGFRPHEEQRRIYADSLREHGSAFTANYVALPGCSEHETGLAVDLGLQKPDIDFLRPEFPYAGVCGEFRKAAPRYGFVERYSEGKDPVTGIAHEPWHFRYVGYPHSAIMTERGLTLEEYVDWLRRFRGPDNAYRFKRGNRLIDVCYMSGDTKLVELPDGAPVQVSGNNVDGFLITVWR